MAVKNVTIEARYGKWTVIGQPESDGRVLCRCDCGSESRVIVSKLRTGRSTHCKGCTRRTHGESNSTGNTRTYRIWRMMKSRCYRPTYEHYGRYGGRGIRVCERWRLSYESFLADMGHAPGNASIDRIDNDGDYCPENCRWATKREQANNTSANRNLTAFGETKSVAMWTSDPRCVVSYSTLRARVVRFKWKDLEKAIAQPTRLSGGGAFSG